MWLFSFFAHIYMYMCVYLCVCIYIHTQCLCRRIIIKIIKVRAITHSQPWNATVTESWQRDLKWSHFFFSTLFSHLSSVTSSETVRNLRQSVHKELIDKNKPLGKWCGWEQWWEQIQLILAEAEIWCSDAGNLFLLQLAHKTHARGIHPDCKEMLWAICLLSSVGWVDCKPSLPLLKTEVWGELHLGIPDLQSDGQGWVPKSSTYQGKGLPRSSSPL